MTTVKLFSGTNCPACVTLKGRLEGLGIDTSWYQEANVNEPENREEVIKLGFRGIPLLVRYDLDGEVVGAIMGAVKADAAYVDIFKGVWENTNVIHEPL